MPISFFESRVDSEEAFAHGKFSQGISLDDVFHLFLIPVNDMTNFQCQCFSHC